MATGAGRARMLEGIRVVDLSRTFAGPLCAMILAELGADVIKVEDPGGGDETRTWPPQIDGESGYYHALNRSKRGITANFKHPDGLRVVHDLVARGDVVIENFTPGVADRLGLGYERLRAINPRLIYCSISGFGQTGPYRTRKGYDPILQAMGGLMSVTGEKGGGPLKTMLPVADTSTGVFACLGILGALFARERGGGGQYLDLAMLDVMVTMLTTVGTSFLYTGLVPPRSGTENPARVPSAAYRCRDGEFVQLVPNQRQWPQFCAIIGLPELASDPRFDTNLRRIEHQEELQPILRGRFCERDSTEWLDLFLEHGIPSGPIYTLDRLFADPQVAARGMVGGFAHPVLGELPAINLPFKFSETPVGIASPPPLYGEHTEAVLAEELGRSVEEIARLRREGAI